MASVAIILSTEQITKALNRLHRYGLNCQVFYCSVFLHQDLVCIASI